MNSLRMVIVLLVLVAISRPADGTEQTPATRLAARFARLAVMLVEVEPLTQEGLDAARIMASEACALDPQNARYWRLRLGIATIAENTEEQSIALARLTSLDPGDEKVRLLRLHDVIGKLNTAEERIRTYEELLEPASLDKLGPPVASRLAMDLALLYDRVGKIDRFSHWLARAVEIDPSNRFAAATAAGFFRLNVDDPMAQAELLTTLMLADPTDFATQTALGNVLLEEGAYSAATRVHTLAIRTHERAGAPPAADLQADLALAQWGSGRAEAALRTITDRQHMVNAYYHQQLQRARPDMDPIELVRVVAPLSPTISTVRAAIHRQLDLPEAATTLAAAQDAYKIAVLQQTQVEDRAPDMATIARLTLELAWISAWLGDDPEVVRGFVAEVEKVRPLSEAARARFEGWIALHEDDLGRARELLGPNADEDPASALGLAEVELREGNRREALRRYALVAKARTGSLIGVWASEQLAEMLGRRLVADAGVTALEQLIESVPRLLDRFPTDSTVAVSIRLTPRETNYGPWEPIIVDVEVANNSPFTLSIDRGGPIRPEVLIKPSVTISGDIATGSLKPIVVEIDRKLRLGPGERVVVPVDLRLHQQLDAVLARAPLRGAIIALEATVNPISTPRGALVAGPMGSAVRNESIRVNGLRASIEWIDEIATRLGAEDPTVDVESLALMTQVVIPGLVAQAPPERRDLLANAGSKMTDAFARLDPVSHAWMLTILPAFDRMEPLMAVARESTHRLVKVCYLVFRATDEQDPVLAEARASEDPTLTTVAQVVTAQMMMNRAREAERQERAQIQNN
jgi:tetratricopeptide (TPR) repeat protein